MRRQFILGLPIDTSNGPKVVSILRQQNLFFLYIGNNKSVPESESESYVTTDGQSASLFWYKAPIWGL
jgi:hypothetical protein